MIATTPATEDRADALIAELNEIQQDLSLRPEHGGADLADRRGLAERRDEITRELNAIDRTAKILATDTRGTIESEGMTLQIVARSWPKGTPTADVIAGKVPAAGCTATEDGRHADFGNWHVGDSAGEVYCERYTAEGRVFHGWIDAATRQLVQAG